MSHVLHQTTRANPKNAFLKLRVVIRQAERSDASGILTFPKKGRIWSIALEFTRVINPRNFMGIFVSILKFKVLCEV
jgi:hypothetical protein